MSHYTTYRITTIDTHGREQPFTYSTFDGGEYQQLVFPHKLKVVNTRHGLGLVAVKKIDANVPILQTQRLIPRAESGTNIDNYLVFIGETSFLHRNVEDDGVHRGDGFSFPSKADLYQAGDYTNDLSLVNSPFPFAELKLVYSKGYISSLHEVALASRYTRICTAHEKETANVDMSPFVDNKTFFAKTTRPIRAGEEILNAYGPGYWLRKLSNDDNEKVRLAAFYVNALNRVAPEVEDATFAIESYKADKPFFLVSKSADERSGRALDAALMKGILYLSTKFNSLPDDAYNFLITPFLNAASAEHTRDNLLKFSRRLKRQA